MSRTWWIPQQLLARLEMHGSYYIGRAETAKASRTYAALVDVQLRLPLSPDLPNPKDPLALKNAIGLKIVVKYLPKDREGANREKLTVKKIISITRCFFHRLRPL